MLDSVTLVSLYPPRILTQQLNRLVLDGDYAKYGGDIAPLLESIYAAVEAYYFQPLEERTGLTTVDKGAD